jgi:hypothetical protein
LLVSNSKNNLNILRKIMEKLIYNIFIREIEIFLRSFEEILLKNRTFEEF